MKLKKSLLVLCSLIIFSGILIGATPEKGMSTKSPVIIGEVTEVKKSEDGNSTMITVQ